MSYSLARRFSKNRENFGNGEVEGVIAPETADHSAGTSALLPMLTLGIPGSATAAVMLGGLMIWGCIGPTLFVEQHDFVWGLIASMYLGNVVSLIVVLATVPLFASILRIPFAIVAPIIVMVCAIGAYSVHNAMLDVVLMLLFGALGYLFKKLGYPIAPLVLAAVLGDKAEDAFRQSMLFSDGQLSVFWSNPLVAGLTGAALAMLLWPLLARCAGALFRRGRQVSGMPPEPASGGGVVLVTLGLPAASEIRHVPDSRRQHHPQPPAPAPVAPDAGPGGTSARCAAPPTRSA